MIGDSSAAWAAAGFTVADETVSIGNTQIRFAPGDARGILGVGVDEASGPIDGMPFGPASDAVAPLAGSAHPNHVIGIDHLVALSTDIERTITALQDAHIELRRERRFGEADNAKRQAFFWLGDVILELAGPAARREGEHATLWGLALSCDDLDAAKATLGEMLSEPKMAVQAGRRIATLRTRELDISVPVALMSPHLAG